MRDAEALAEQLQPQVQEKDWEIEVGTHHSFFLGSIH